MLNNDLINDPWTQCLNSTMQAKLAGTVWANYRLVTTQWPGGSPSAGGSPFIPANLTNTTMETYIQNSNSCMDCHSAAQTAGSLPQSGGPVSAAFSYLLQDAQPTTGTPAMLRSRRQ